MAAKQCQKNKKNDAPSEVCSVYKGLTILCEQINRLVLSGGDEDCGIDGIVLGLIV